MHNDLGTAVEDLRTASEARDVAEIRSVAAQLATFLDRNLANAHDIAPTFPEMSSQMVGALTTIRDAATTIRDGIDAGDQAAINEGFMELVVGMDAYKDVQPGIAALVPEAFRQTGGLVR